MIFFLSLLSLIMISLSFAEEPSLENISPKAPPTIFYVNHSLAVCNDGSPAAYYLQSATPGSPDENKWLIMFEGGGSCNSVEECDLRYADPNTNRWMTSNNMPPLPFKGIFLDPSITGWNKVFLHYCSSDSWAGSKPASQGVPYHFNGFHVARQILMDIPSLVNATHVLVSGTSSGVPGAIRHAPFIRDNITPGAKVQALLSCGAISFSSAFPPYNTSLPPSEGNAIISMEFWNSQLDPICVNYFPNMTHLCMTPLVTVQFLDAYNIPTMVQLSYTDPTSLVIKGIPPEYTNSTAEQQYGIAFAQNVSGNLLALPSTIALFTTDCTLHTGVTRDPYYTLTVETQGGPVTFQEAVHAWWIDHTLPNRYVDVPGNCPASYNCNPSCPYQDIF